MKRLILALALVIVIFSGCTEKVPLSGDLKNLMVKSSGNISSYGFKISDTQTQSLKDLAKNNITNEYNTTTRSTNTEVSAAVDLNNYKAMADMVTTTTIKGSSGSPTIATQKGSEFNIGNMTYTNGNGNWTALKDPVPADKLWAEGRYNLIQSRAQSINASNFEVVGSESIDGTDCYKLKMNIDSQDNLQNLYNMLTSMIFPFMPEVNETEIIKDSNIENFAWVDKKTNLLKKFKQTLSMKVTPNIVGVVDIRSGTIQRLNGSIKLVEVSLDTDSTENYYDFNKPVVIEVPEDALKVVPILPSPIEVTTASG